MLSRSNPTVKAVEATHGNISRLVISLSPPVIVVTISWGNLWGNKFIPIFSQDYELRDEINQNVSVTELLTIVDGKVTLAQPAEANLIVRDGDSVLEEGAGYTRDGLSLIVSAPDGTPLAISYQYTQPGRNHVSELASKMPDPGKNMYENIRDIAWQYLLDIGLVEGTLV